MNRWAKFSRDQDGQIIYMALAAMLALTLFALVLANVAYVAAMKVKAQNTADVIALSVAVRKARVFNQITEINQWIDLVALEEALGPVASKRYLPYVEPFELPLYYFGGAKDLEVLARVMDFNRQIASAVDRLAQANGLGVDHQQWSFYPADLQVGLDIIPQMVNCWGVIPPAVPHPLIPLAARFEPTESGRSVQTRLVWPLKNALIGGKRLGVVLPNIVVRSRAELYDPDNRDALNHNWQVRLAEPKMDVDQYLEKKMR